jgi:hypothetical protein
LHNSFGKPKKITAFFTISGKSRKVILYCNQIYNTTIRVFMLLVQRLYKTDTVSALTNWKIIEFCKLYFFHVRLLCFSLLLISFSYAQSDFTQSSRNNFFFELLGNGGFYSINYERFILDDVTSRIGVGIWNDPSSSGGKTSLVTIPILTSGLIGSRKSKLEIGLGFLAGRQKFTSSFGRSLNWTAPIADGTGVVGYRYQPFEQGFVFRAGISCFYVFNGDHRFPYNYNRFSIMPGLSFGGSF